MKKVLILSFLFSAFLSFGQQQANSFEGVLKVTNSTTPEFVSTFYVEGEKTAANFGAKDKKDKNSQRYIINSTERTEIALKRINGKKQAIKLRRQNLILPKEYVNQKKAKGQKKFTKTGEKKTIQGYNCEKIVVANNEQTLTAWLTKDIPLTFRNIYPFNTNGCLLYTSPSPRDATLSRMPSSA